MEKRGIGLEVKVGVFVLIGLIVLGYMTLKVERRSLKAVEGYEISALFDSAAGLVKNSEVQIAGIEVGRVKDITLAGNQAQVRMTIKKGVQIAADARAVLRTMGVLGDKYVEILPGTDQTAKLKAGGTISDTRSTIELDHLLAKALPAMDNIRSVSQSLNEVLGTEEGKNNLKETFINVRKTTEDVRQITLGITQGEGTIGKLVKDDRLYRDMLTTVSGLKDTVGDIKAGQGSLGKFLKDETLYQDTQKTMLSLQKVANKIETGEGTLGRLVNDETLYKEAMQTLANLNQATQKINQGEGTLGKLVNDEGLYKEAKYAIRSVTKATEGFQEQVPVSIFGTIIGTIIK
ncbi:MAG: MCE family protein [Deltaproteobacteria bacterium]|nr:MCE family protein [Deltaproteobacteria bacterium]